MSPPELRNPLIVEKCNIAETQGKDFKVAIKSMFKILKNNVNKSINEIYEHTIKQWNEIKKNYSRHEIENEITQQNPN